MTFFFAFFRFFSSSARFFSNSGRNKGPISMPIYLPCTCYWTMKPIDGPTLSRDRCICDWGMISNELLSYWIFHKHFANCIAVTIVYINCSHVQWYFIIWKLFFNRLKMFITCIVSIDFYGQDEYMHCISPSLPDPPMWMITRQYHSVRLRYVPILFVREN